MATRRNFETRVEAEKEAARLRAAPSEPEPETPQTSNTDEMLAMLRDSLAAGDMDPIRGVLSAWKRSKIVKIVDGQTLQVWRDDRWLQYGVPYPTEREAILEAFEVAAVAYNNPPTTKGE